jgi:hypothetical protein
MPGFSAGKPYVFEGKDGKRIATDLYVIAQHGSVKKDYQFQFMSNQRFTESDMDTYRHSLTETNAKVPTQSFLERKYDDLKGLQNHYWTDADISARIAKSKKYAHLLQRSDSSSQPKIATQSETAAARVAELNRKNRILEAERVRKAQLEQQRQKKMDQKKEAARRKAEEEAKKAVWASMRCLMATGVGLVGGIRRSRVLCRRRKVRGRGCRRLGNRRWMMILLRVWILALILRSERLLYHRSVSLSCCCRWWVVGVLLFHRIYPLFLVTRSFCTEPDPYYLV